MLHIEFASSFVCSKWLPYSSQCAAVKTHWSWMRIPPHTWFCSFWMDTIHGWSFLTSLPPIMDTSKQAGIEI